MPTTIQVSKHKTQVNQSGALPVRAIWPHALSNHDMHAALN